MVRPRRAQSERAAAPDNHRTKTRREHMRTLEEAARSGRAWVRAIAGVAIVAAIALPASAWAQVEIKLGHVGEPGSIFQKSADEFAKRVNAKLAGKAKVI